MDINRVREQIFKEQEAGNEKQHKAGKLTARERIERLFDEGTFQETGLLVRHRSTAFGLDKKSLPSDGVITGFGSINSKIVYAAFQDFRVNGGTLGEMHAKKIALTIERAIETGSPFVFVADSGGARIQEGVDALAGFGDIFQMNIKASGVIPQISIVLGPCAGGAVYSPALTDFVFTVDKISRLFITGPEVVKAVTGENVGFEELGGATVHTSKSGVANFIFDNEDACFNSVRHLLDFIPRNNFEIPERWRYSDCPYSIDENIIPSDNTKPYDVRTVIRSIADGGEFFEVSENYAKNVSVGFCRLEGRSVGVVANNPAFLAGSLDIDASDKAARFVRFCDSFNIALLTLVDVPGYMPGTSQEHGGIIRHGAKLLYAYGEASVPKITVILRKAFGGAYIAMCSKHLGADMVFAYPDSQIAVMGAEGACGIIFSSEINNAADKDAMRRKKIREYSEKLMNPIQAAERGYVDDIIIPNETRNAVCSAFEAFALKKVMKLEKKHGNIPL